MFYIRLIQSRLKKIPLYRPKETPSSYIGTEMNYDCIGEIEAEIQPLSAVMTTEQYGAKISRGIALFCEIGTDIKEGDRVYYGGSCYDITGVLTYGNIIRAEAEKNVGYQG